jgi:putative hydrolase of the HAD superfamily
VSSSALKAVFFDFGDTLIVEEPLKHLWEMASLPVPHALEVLGQLRKRFKLGIISNTVGSGDSELAAVLERIGARPLIDAIVTSRDFGRAKPDPSIYQEAARRLQVPLAETCMVGDRLDTDIAGALQAGIPGIWLRHDHSVEVPGITPTRIIRGLKELPDCLDALDPLLGR